VVTRQPGSVRQGLSYVGAAALADVLAAGYELVVFEFVFERRRHIERFLTSLRADVPVHLLTLWAPLEIVLARDAARAERERLGERVTACWTAMAANLSELSAVIDATASVEHVTAEARRTIAAGNGRLGGRSLAA
jgi:hypothetical protein